VGRPEHDEDYSRGPAILNTRSAVSAVLFRRAPRTDKEHRPNITQEPKGRKGKCIEIDKSNITKRNEDITLAQKQKL
jgi:hypothetical protein